MKTQTLMLWTACALLAHAISLNAAESRDEKVRKDKLTVEAGGLWIYNNLDMAIAEAKRDDKPILVTFRCIP